MIWQKILPRSKLRCSFKSVTEQNILLFIISEPLQWSFIVDGNEGVSQLSVAVTNIFLRPEQIISWSAETCTTSNIIPEMALIDHSTFICGLIK